MLVQVLFYLEQNITLEYYYNWIGIYVGATNETGEGEYTGAEAFYQVLYWVTLTNITMSFNANFTFFNIATNGTEPILDEAGDLIIDLTSWLIILIWIFISFLLKNLNLFL